MQNILLEKRTTSVKPAIVEKAVFVCVIRVRVPPPSNTVSVRQLATLLGLKEEEVLTDELLQVPVIDEPLVFAGAHLLWLPCSILEFSPDCYGMYQIHGLWLSSDV